ncbi:MAG: hypothetical protein WA996_17405 [Candidatus Promineifilaceae bacterium]
MKSVTLVFLVVTTLCLAITAPQTLTMAPQAVTIVVTSTADSGPGSLRQALLNAQSGDTITFDPAVFPPTAPVIISITGELPHISQGNLTIDASNAGVILDGSNVPGEWVGGLQIVKSDGNIIRGIHVTNFSGTGIAISGDAKYNLIGGDRSAGIGPYGQGNLTSHNEAGIGLWSDGTIGASLNTVRGNLVGSDAAGIDDLGNRGTGIMVFEGANNNIFGPDNVVAFNGGAGILVGNPGSVGNTITQNSIHDNGAIGIGLLDGANTELLPPVVSHFNLHPGSMTGATCPRCTLEIFSDDDDEGAIYEGRTTADGTGYFTFSKGASFTGPHLTVTTTDIDGNTSRFMSPTSGAAGSRMLQQDNNLPIVQFKPKHSRDLLDNRINTYFDSFGYPEFYDLYIYSLGVKRARAAIAGQEPELVDWDKPEFSIHPDHDAVFTRMADNGLTITYILTFWDKETYPGGEGAPCARFKTEGEIERYLEFVQFIVHHFKDRVQYYELWNEPDIPNYCPKWIEATDYINLVKRTVPIIREEYPEAKIQVGGVSNTRFPNASDYLFDILESDIMPLVDVVSWHPMYGTSPAYDFYEDYYYQYPSFVQEIKDVASAHGFDGEYQADELTWRTPDTADPGQPWVYSPTVAAKYFGRGILMHLGMDVGVGVTGDNNNENNRLFGNLSTIMAGAKPTNIDRQVQSSYESIVSYTFSLPNGDHLIALWTNGVAVDDDPGVAATLILPDFSDQRVVGIDVLHGYEQQMITSDEDGNLVIRDLLVKDYPVVFRLSSTRSSFLPILSNRNSFGH